MLLTVTVAADDLEWGLSALRCGLTKMKRRKAWKIAVAGGEQHAEVKPAGRGSFLAWNVHAHLIVELVPGATLDQTALGIAWKAGLAPFGLTGSLHFEPVRAHWAIRWEP